MSLGLYMDENVRGAITRGLKKLEVDVLTVQADDRIGIDDPEVLERATTLRRVLFSQDDDLLVEAKRRQTQGLYLRESFSLIKLVFLLAPAFETWS